MAGVERGATRAKRGAWIAVLAAVAIGASLVWVHDRSAGAHPASEARAGTVDVALVTGDTNVMEPVDLSVDPPVLEAPLELPAPRADHVVVVRNRTALVLGQQTRDITMIDLTRTPFAVTGRIPLPAGGYPGSLTASPDGRWALVNNLWENVPVTIIDLTKSPPAVMSVRIPGKEHDVAAAFTPDGGTALIASDSSNEVYRIDLTTAPPTVLSPIRLVRESGGIAVAPNGKLAVVTGLLEGISVIDLTANPPRVIASLNTPRNLPHAVAITADSRTAYIGNILGNSVTPLSLDTSPPTLRTPIGLNGGQHPVGMVLRSGDRQLLVANTYTNDLTPIDLAVNPPKPGPRIPVSVTRPLYLAIVSLPARPGARTTTALAASVSPSVSRQPVRLTATVAASGHATPEGTVSFTVDGRSAGPPVALRDGAASVTIDSMGAGRHRLVAWYSGDGDTFNPSSRELIQAVNRAATSSALTASANPSVFGQRVVLNAKVTTEAPGAGTPAGTVTFSVDGTAIGAPTTVVAGRASAALPRLAAGAHRLTMTYSGDASYLPSNATLTPDAEVRPAATTVTLESGRNPAPSGEPVTFSALVDAVAPGGGQPQGTVTFAVDGVVYGSPLPLVDGHAVATIALTTGRHRVEARYSGSTDFVPSTGAVDQDTGGS
jgi:hypothetical protein